MNLTLNEITTKIFKSPVAAVGCWILIELQFGLYITKPAQSQRTNLHRVFHFNPAASELLNKYQHYSTSMQATKHFDCSIYSLIKNTNEEERLGSCRHEPRRWGS